MLLTLSRFHSQSYPPHAHDGYSFSLVTEGIHRFSVETETLEARAGEIRIVHPYELHRTLTGTWQHLNLSLSTREVEDAALSLGAECPVLFRRKIKDPLLNTLFEELYQDRDHALSRILRRLIEHHLLPASSNRDDPISPEMERAKAYLHIHACDPSLNLDRVAKEAGMSKYHFLRMFKSTFGRTPHRYLQNLRIDCVRRQIRRGSSLSEAAYACGFYDQSHMIRIYRKFYGHTPGSLRVPKAQ